MIINQNVPICPECKAMLFKRIQNHKTYYCCLDCMSIFALQGVGKSENELIVDRKEQEDD